MAGGDLGPLCEVLHHNFARPDLLEEALTHSSADLPFNYERLEFLGDRVLGLVVAAWLSELYPGDNEGDLAEKFNFLVRRESLERVAAAINLGRYLRTGKSERQAAGRSHTAILANACEALVAALYLDGGMDAASGFIHARWQELVDELGDLVKDHKTALQEWALARGPALPVYADVERAGPDHDPIFTVQVRVEDLPPMMGEGRSKKAAERAAAEALLVHIRAQGLD